MADPNEMFDQAATGDLFNFRDHVDELVVFWPLDFEEDFNTVNGLQDIIRADILVVDGEHAGEFYNGSILFGNVVVPALKPKLGRQVLGRVGQGASKPGKNAPWIIKPFEDGDAAAAVKAIEAHKAGEFEAPASEESTAKPAASRGGRAAATAKAETKVEIPAEKAELAKTLLASKVPNEAIAAATGFTVEQLQQADILPI